MGRGGEEILSTLNLILTLPKEVEQFFPAYVLCRVEM